MTVQQEQKALTETKEMAEQRAAKDRRNSLKGQIKQSSRDSSRNKVTYIGLKERLRNKPAGKIATTKLKSKQAIYGCVHVLLSKPPVHFAKLLSPHCRHLVHNQVVDTLDGLLNGV